MMGRGLVVLVGLPRAAVCPLASPRDAETETPI
jgi:hypothetical protein